MSVEYEPVIADQLARGDLVRRSKNGQTRLITLIEELEDPQRRLRVHFEDSGWPYFLETKRTNRWYRRVRKA